MVGFSNVINEFKALGASVVAASVDVLEKAQEVAEDLAFPVAYGVTRADADMLGSWWEDRRNIIQPSEFILGADNTVVASSYSDGPVGRMDGADAARMINFLESRKAAG